MMYSSLSPQRVGGTAYSGSVLPPPRSLAACGIPGGQATRDVARVEAALPEDARNGTADVEAVRAVDRHGRIGRELLAPLVDALGVPVDRARHHVRRPPEVKPGSSVDDLNRFAAGEPRGQLFDRNGRYRLVEGASHHGRSSLARLLEPV